MFTNAAEAIAFTREAGIEFIDCRFVDLPGVWQHFNIPVAQFGEASFTDGMMFDGS